MKQLTALVWKEWHEARRFLAVAVFLFFVMPILGGFEAQAAWGSRFYFEASPWVLSLGGVLAILVAVGLTCRDLGGRLEEFWRSRAMGTIRWILVKYAMGLFVVLACCIVPLCIEIASDRFHIMSDPAAVIWYPFLWTALYSLAFLAGCLVHRTAHATMLALAGMLLLYFLPLVLPPIQWMSLDWVMDRSRSAVLGWEAPFVAGMLALAAACLLVSITAVTRGWQIVSGTKMLYWSVGSALLVLFASAAFRLGTNLPILYQEKLPPQRHVRFIAVEGSYGMVLTTFTRDYGEFEPEAHSLRLENGSFRLSPAFPLRQGTFDWYPSAFAIHGNILFSVARQHVGDKEYSFSLQITNLDDPTTSGTLDLGRGAYEHATLFPRGDRLYVCSSVIWAFDIRTPAKPRLLFQTDIRWGEAAERRATQLVRPLPRIAGLSPHERLDIAMSLWELPFENDIVAWGRGDGVSTYKLTQLNENFAVFDLAGHYEPSLLEHVFGSGSYREAGSNGLVYLVSSSDTLRTGTSHIKVFDIRDPQRPRPVAHFSMPLGRSAAVCPLPDGRSLVGGDRLLLLGKPTMKQ